MIKRADLATVKDTCKIPGLYHHNGAPCGAETHNDEATSWKVRGLNSGKGTSFFSSPKRWRRKKTRPDPNLKPTHPPVRWVIGSFFLRKSDQDMRLTAHLQLEPKLWMTGSVPPFHFYAFMVSTNTTLLLLRWALISIRNNRADENKNRQNEPGGRNH
jgi:hypothetical protein